MLHYYTTRSYKLRESYSQNKSKQPNKVVLYYRNTISGIRYAKNTISGVRGLERYQICIIGIGVYRSDTQIDKKNAYSLISGRWV